VRESRRTDRVDVDRSRRGRYSLLDNIIMLSFLGV